VLKYTYMSFGYQLLKENRRSIAIKVLPTGIVQVAAPLWVSDAVVQRFVATKEDWVQKHLYQHKLARRDFPTPRYVEGDMLPLQGTKMLLKVRDSGTKNGAVFVKNVLTIYTYKKSAKDSVRDWYKGYARAVIDKRLRYWSNMMELEYNTWRLKDNSSNWGSCSSRKNINLNWRLIMAPPHIIDYVIIHELAHLKHMDHSVRFWGLVAEYDPRYETHRTWLARNQALMAWL
jgi:predicted metal-dependent hydrolase